MHRDVEQSALTDGGDTRQTPDRRRLERVAIDAQHPPATLADQHVAIGQEREPPGMVEPGDERDDAKALTLALEDFVVVRPGPCSRRDHCDQRDEAAAHTRPWRRGTARHHVRR